ncbi:hypothetical protein KOM00_04065 [Geomonas sp. Red69]|uniref:hypothetical protein n=1 Tax=Geomonas diazotrophica TaxID=2843197 RepID=UPI001C106710|nr:hypothetical protein [Geomonas diazotrophica]MBU5635901.1 hypothetical protein [Geomonas diazotrophica]
MLPYEILQSEIENLLEKTRQFSQGGESASFFETLTFIKQSRYLAPYNALLVKQQRSSATLVIPEERWRSKYGRNLRPGVQPIVIMKIFGPVEFVYDIKDIEGIEENPIPGYKPNLPTEEICRALFPTEGDLRGIEGLYDDVVRACRRQRLQLEEYPLGITLSGRVRVKDARFLTPRKGIKAENRLINYVLQVNSTHPLEIRFAALVHELAHIFCGHLDEFQDGIFKRKELSDQELEAEAVSYLFCYRHGFRPKSEQYLASYLIEGRTPSVAGFGPIIDALKKIEDMLKPVEVQAVPTKFRISVGGYTGSSYCLELRDEALIYEECEWAYEPVRTVEIKAAFKDWRHFWLECQKVGLWSWQSKYEGVELCDGTDWEIEIIWDNREVFSCGTNAFPGDDVFTETSDYPPPFKKFLGAVRKLVGGLPFT